MEKACSSSTSAVPEELLELQGGDGGGVGGAGGVGVGVEFHHMIQNDYLWRTDILTFPPPCDCNRKKSTVESRSGWI